jgi:hypothetical protein
VRAVGRRLSLERATQLAIVATILTAVLSAGAIVEWLTVARVLRWPALAMLAALALAAAIRRRASRPPLDLFAVVTVLLVLIGVSAAWSVAPATTLGRGVALGVLLVACGALAFATAGRPDAVWRTLQGALAGVALVAIGGILVLIFRHDRAVVDATIVSPRRYQGLGGGPNTAMMVLAIGVPLAAHALVAARRPLARAAAAGLLLLLVGSIVASGSRGALVAAFAGLFLYAVVVARGTRRRLAAGAVVVVLFGISVALSAVPDPLAAAPVPAAAPATPPAPPKLVVPRPPRLQDDIGLPPPGVGDTAKRERTLLGSSGRAEAWEGAVREGAQRPLLGYGFGTENLAFVDRYAYFNSNYPENSYIGLFLQLGLAGIGAFVAIVVIAARSLARAARAAPGPGVGVAAACAGAVTTGMVLGASQSYLVAAGNNATATVWICFFLLWAAAIGLRREAPASA